MRAYFDRRGHYRGVSLGWPGLLVVLIPGLVFMSVVAVVFCWPLLLIRHDTAWRLVAELGWLALIGLVVASARAWWRRFDTLENWPPRKRQRKPPAPHPTRPRSTRTRTVH